MFNHKKIIVTVCLTATVVFAATASMQTTEPEKPEWKNLKVLPKKISKQDLDKVMDDWRDALGVRCGFCHARNAETNKNDFASDAKPEKEAARKMMTMTAKINSKYFKADKDDKTMTAAITCYVCHHGTAHPESIAPPRPPRAPGQGQKPQAAPAGSTPPAPPAGSVPTSPVTTTPPAK
ncbi:photosynthetic reaction center cytochrome c subunit [Mucilaginibacter gracilis]|uniref:Photosynthetic reaction center cytochrome c subunit n=1 Tax=Mucilaginibacter gracilis TaxID=423350 RepID=A0A495J2Z2_9SPHI|nr:c-type cytochrome [Mucilaginibacter gracilis]RKR82738.1 photosynthetic reaction center cytochrome c subunit [Mucilaginibacter gracilis]